MGDRGPTLLISKSGHAERLPLRNKAKYQSIYERVDKVPLWARIALVNAFWASGFVAMALMAYLEKN